MQTSLREARQAKIRAARAAATFAENSPDAPGDPNEYFSKLRVCPGTLYVVFGRVSTRRQEEEGHLEEQIRELHEYIAVRGGIVLEAPRRVGSGRNVEGLTKVFAFARENNATIVVADSVCRFVRSISYGKDNQRGTPTRRQLERIKVLAGGLILATRLAPDTTPGEVRAYQTERGRKMAERLRITRIERRKLCMKYVLELIEEGIPLRAVAERVSRRTGVPLTHTTVRDWVIKAKLCKEAV